MTVAGKARKLRLVSTSPSPTPIAPRFDPAMRDLIEAMARAQAREDAQAESETVT